MKQVLGRVCVAGLILAIAGVLFAGEALFAQSGLEAGRDLSRPSASSPGSSQPGTEGTKLNTQIPTSKQAVLPYNAEAGPLTLINCSARSVSVNTYNSNDGVLLVPYQVRAIASGAKSGLSCATKSCKLRIGSHTTGAISGYRVFTDGRVHTTNKAAMDQGCAVYSVLPPR